MRSWVLDVGRTGRIDPFRTFGRGTHDLVDLAEPFLVLRGCGVVESGEGLVFLRAGVLCGFGDARRLRFTVVEPISIVELSGLAPIAGGDGAGMPSPFRATPGSGTCDTM